MRPPVPSPAMPAARAWAISLGLHGVLAGALVLWGSAAGGIVGAPGPQRPLETRLAAWEPSLQEPREEGEALPPLEVFAPPAFELPTPRLPEPRPEPELDDVEDPRQGTQETPGPSLAAAGQRRSAPALSEPAVSAAPVAPRPVPAQPPAVVAPRPAPLQLLFEPLASGYYPAEALRRGERGTVTVGMSIGPDGRVKGAWLLASSGSALLDRAALTMVWAYRFNPGADDRRAHRRITFAP